MSIGNMTRMPAPDKKAMWLDWTHDALHAYSAPEEAETEDMVDDMIAVATDYADGMLDEFESRFGPDGSETASKSSRRRKPTRRRANGNARAEEEEEETED